MLKQYKILVNEGKGSENVLVTVPAGAGARGNPTRITAKVDTRYELQDDLKGKGLAPDQVRGKRVGKNLYLMFEDNGKPDVIIEGYYDPINQSQVPTIVGKAENGSFYEYIPHDPELSSMSTTLKDGYTPAMLSLGGGPIAGGAFELAGLPLVAAAAGGGLGGLGWLAAGLGAAALGGGGGGGGSGGGTPDTTPPNGGNKPVVVIEADNATDNKYINKAEFEAVGKPAKLKVYASFDNVNKTVTTDDFVVFTVNGVAQTPRKLTAAEVTAGKAYIDVDTPAEDGKITVTAYLQDAALNKTEIGSDESTLDTIAPNTDPKNPNTLIAPVVHIDNDKSEPGNSGGDTYVNAAELADYKGFFQVTATFNTDYVKLGDSVTFNAKEILGTATSIRTSITRLLNADEIRLGSATEKFDAPKEGSALQVTALLEDAAQNKSPLSNVDAATLFGKLPTATAGLAPDSDNGNIVKDSITNDTTPLLNIDTSFTVTKILLFNITNPSVTDKNPISIPVVLDAGNVQMPTLPYGRYQALITVVDQYKNTKDVTSNAFTVTDVNAQADTKEVQEGGLNHDQTSLVKENVLTNDYDEFSVLTGATPKATLSLSQVTYGGNAIKIGQDITTNYGTFNIQANGEYSYSLNNTTAQALKEGDLKVEDFKYSVLSSDGFSRSDVSLQINVKGANDPATILMKDGNVVGVSSVSIYGTGSLGAKGTSIVVTDVDSTQNFLKVGSSPDMNTEGATYEHQGGLGGMFVLTLGGANQTLKDLSTNIYSWNYAFNNDPTDQLIKSISTDTTFHDLLTITSSDGTVNQTLEAIVGDSTTKTVPDLIHEFYTSTTSGLTAIGNILPTFKDTLFIKADNQRLDLTAVTTHVSNMESFDIRGTGQSGSAANTIKIDLKAVTESTAIDNGHKALYIIGDSGDKVEIVGVADWTKDLNASTASTYVYYNKNAHEELIIQNAINNITFV